MVYKFVYYKMCFLFQAKSPINIPTKESITSETSTSFARISPGNFFQEKTARKNL